MEQVREEHGDGGNGRDDDGRHGWEETRRSRTDPRRHRWLDQSYRRRRRRRLLRKQQLRHDGTETRLVVAVQVWCRKKTL